MKMEDEQRLLPVVKLYGSEHLVETGNRQLKKLREPESTIWFYSERGRQMKMFGIILTSLLFVLGGMIAACAQ